MKRLLTIFTCLVVFASVTTTSFAQLGGGDLCSNATTISALPFTDNGSTASANDDYNEVCPYTLTGAPDVVYKYTPAASGFVDMQLCTGTTNYDTKLYVYAGTCGAPNSGTEIACNDDACTSPLFPSPFVSALTNVAVTAGTTYFIIVDGYDAASLGNYTLIVDNAANPPGGTDLDVVAGSLGDYTQVPCSQVVPDSFFAAVFNAGSMTQTGVSVNFDVLDNGASIFADVSSNTEDILAAQTATFNGSTAYALPTAGCDTGNAYVLQFVHSNIPDDSSANDTIFDFKFVNDSTLSFDLAVFAGADIFIANISAATATAELACWYIMNATDTLTSVTGFLQPDVTEIGQMVTAKIYNFLDTVPFAVSNPLAMDTGQFAYDFEFPGGVILEKDSGYFVALNNGTVAVGLTDVLTTGFSSWGRQSSPDDNWGFFSGLDWMIWANFGPVKQVCPIPQNLTANVTGPQTVSLSWDPVPGALAYELTGGVAGNPGSYIDPIIRVGQSNTTFNVINLCINFSYEWTVRTICDIAGTDTTRSEYASVNTFTTGVCGSPTPASTSVSGSSATLMWTPVNGAIGYLISGQAQGGQIVTLQVLGGASSQFVVNNLPAANYLWQVRAACALSTLCVPSPNFGGAAASSFSITGPPAKAGWNQDMFNPVIYGEVNIFPNPAADQTTIQFEDAAAQVEVYDIEGRLMSVTSSIENGNIILNTSTLQNGVYQIMLIGETTTTTEKLVIAR